MLHSGVYYAPGSVKARLTAAGSASMLAYADSRGVAVRRAGKLIVASRRAELAGLDGLTGRGRANGVAVQRLEPAEARSFEPFLECVGALRVPATAVIDYPAVCRALAADLDAVGATLSYRQAVTGFVEERGAVRVLTATGEFAADVVVNCAGLYADRLAGCPSDVRIVPFRGEYFALRPERAHLVQALIYPVPDPALPFLGVHLTRGVDGTVHVGPNAVPALAREGYSWRVVRPGELAAVLTFPGFWRLARRHAGTGTREVLRSLSRRRFAADAARMVPDITADDLVRVPAGVRAQAVRADGSLVDDFVIRRAGRIVHVLNAPSPAATCALEIGAHIAALLAGIG